MQAHCALQGSACICSSAQLLKGRRRKYLLPQLCMLLCSASSNAISCV